MKKLCALLLVSAFQLYAADPQQHNIDLNKVSIELLKEHEKLIEEICKMRHESVGKNFYKDNYTSILKSQMNDDQLPLAFVAIFNQKPIGLCALRNTCIPIKDAVPWSDTHPDKRPWLMICVASACQKQGVGTKLIMHTLRYAHEKFGFTKAYSVPADNKIEELYRRKGCVKIADTTLHGKPAIVMEVDILNQLKAN